jgi:hypothetical protein
VSGWPYRDNTDWLLALASRWQVRIGYEEAKPGEPKGQKKKESEKGGSTRMDGRAPDSRKRKEEEQKRRAKVKVEINQMVRQNGDISSK